MYFDIDFNIIRVVDTEIMHNGKKVKTNKGDCDINMIMRMEYDYGGNWSKHWLLKHFALAFPMRIYKDEWDTYWDMGYRDAYEFQQTIKDFWKFKQFTEEPEYGAYDRPKGLPDYLFVDNRYFLGRQYNITLSFYFFLMHSYFVLKTVLSAFLLTMIPLRIFLVLAVGLFVR